LNEEPKRKMSVRDKLLIWLVILFGLGGAGYMLYLNSLVDDYQLDQHSTM